MPYPTRAVRKVLKGVEWEDFFYVTSAENHKDDGSRIDDDKGKLNYLYTTQFIIPEWIEEKRYFKIHDFCKDAFEVNDEQAAKICAFFEFYRREGGKYEDGAIKKNGDVY